MKIVKRGWRSREEREQTRTVAGERRLVETATSRGGGDVNRPRDQSNRAARAGREKIEGSENQEESNREFYKGSIARTEELQ